MVAEMTFIKIGEVELNTEKWPDGWEPFKRINKSLHDAGHLYPIFHTYAFFMTKNRNTYTRSQ